MGATLTTEKISRAFLGNYGSRKTFFHGHTYTANPLSAAAALASLEVFNKEKTLEKVAKLAPLFHAQMEKLKGLPIVDDVRYIGMIGAVELKSAPGLKIYKDGLKRKIILRPLGKVVYLYLPLCVKSNEIKMLVSKLRDSIKAINN